MRRRYLGAADGGARFKKLNLLHSLTVPSYCINLQSFHAPLYGVLIAHRVYTITARIRSSQNLSNQSENLIKGSSIIGIACYWATPAYQSACRSIQDDQFFQIVIGSYKGKLNAYPFVSTSKDQKE